MKLFCLHVFLGAKTNNVSKETGKQDEILLEILMNRQWKSMPLFQKNNTLTVHVHDACTCWLYVRFWKFTVDIYAVTHVGV